MDWNKFFDRKSFLCTADDPKQRCSAKLLPKHGTVALYFAKNDAESQEFIPILTKAFRKIQGNGDELHIVFVSSDDNESAFLKHFENQAWFAVPFTEKRLRKSLKREFKVSDKPTLVLMDAASGEMITREGTIIMRSVVANEKDVWRILPKSENIEEEEQISCSGGKACCFFVFLWFFFHSRSHLRRAVLA